MRSCLLAAFASLALLLVAPISSATSVIVVVTPKEAWIGADGKGIMGGTRSVEACKIHVSGGVVFAFTGFASSDYSKFSADEIAQTAINEGGTLSEVVQRFKQRIAPSLTAATRVVYNTNRQGYDRDFRGKPLLEAVFVTGSPVPQGRYLRYELKEIPDGPLAVIGEDFAVLRFVAIGRNEAIRRYFYEHSLSVDIVESDPLGFVRVFLKEEIELEPETVGPPVSIVSIGADGASWAERGGCGK